MIKSSKLSDVIITANSVPPIVTISDGMCTKFSIVFIPPFVAIPNKIATKQKTNPVFFYAILSEF